jgi:hypothetical protein
MQWRRRSSPALNIAIVTVVAVVIFCITTIVLFSRAHSISAPPFRSLKHAHDTADASDESEHEHDEHGPTHPISRADVKTPLFISSASASQPLKFASKKPTSTTESYRAWWEAFRSLALQPSDPLLRMCSRAQIGDDDCTDSELVHVSKWPSTPHSLIRQAIGQSPTQRIDVNHERAFADGDFFSSIPDSFIPSSHQAPFDRLLPAYTKLFNSIISGQNNKFNASFILVTPGAQMANRLRVSVCALTLGLLLNKAVYIQFDEGWYASLTDILDVAVDIRSLQVRSHFTSILSQPLSPRTAVCDPLRVNENSAFSIQGVTYLTPLLLRNPMLRARFKEVFGSHDDYYRLIFSRFFRPNQIIRSRIADFRLQNQLFSKIVIGLHMRTGGDFRDDMPDIDWKHFQQCAQFMTARALNRHKIANRQATADPDVVWFVAADTQKARDHALKMFGSSSSTLDGKGKKPEVQPFQLRIIFKSFAIQVFIPTGSGLVLRRFQDFQHCRRRSSRVRRHVDGRTGRWSSADSRLELFRVLLDHGRQDW